MSNRRNIVTMSVGAAGVVALAGGCGWPTVPTAVRPGSSTSSGTVVACPAASLVPRIDGESASAGVQRYSVVLTNKGSATCSIIGYPVLVLRDGSGRLLPPAYPTGISATVRLSVGSSATAVMAVSSADCTAAPIAAIAAVSPPGSSYSTTLPVHIPVCRPTISPVSG